MNAAERAIEKMRSGAIIRVDYIHFGRRAGYHAHIGYRSQTGEGFFSPMRWDTFQKVKATDSVERSDTGWRSSEYSIKS